MNRHPKQRLNKRLNYLGSSLRVFRKTDIGRIASYSRKKSKVYFRKALRLDYEIFLVSTRIILFHSRIFYRGWYKTLTFSHFSCSSHFVVLMIIKFQGLSHALLEKENWKSLLRHKRTKKIENGFWACTMSLTNDAENMLEKLVRYVVKRQVSKPLPL